MRPRSGSSPTLGGKKQDHHLRLNGKDRLRIKTLHGSFEFEEQRLLLPTGFSQGHLRHTGQGGVSSALEEFCLYYAGRLSYAEVGRLTQRLTGERLVCEQTLGNWVRRKAQGLAQGLQHGLRAEVEALRNSAGDLAAPKVAEQVEIYEEAASEVVVMSDAIGVKAQKRTRERGMGASPEKGLKRISTDMMLIEGRDGSFHHLCGGLDGSATLSELGAAHLRKEWGDHPEPLPVVAITDGARSIRLMLEGLFGRRLR